jgi:glycerophosphoryl diester phosphodiesterase
VTRIELDIQLTKDGSCAIFHDDDLVRFFGRSKMIRDCTKAELEELKFKNNEGIPFLEDVIGELTATTELNIEIKNDGTEPAVRLLEVLKNFRDQDKLIISSFNPEPLICLSQRSDLRIACLYDGGFKWPNLSTLSPLLLMNSCRAKIFHPHTRFVTEGLMDQARARDWQVFPYVGFKTEAANKRPLWESLRRLGVDGLCTNFPREFKDWTQGK